jgi:2-oxoglutarate dehydrogenase E1 component
MLSRQVTSALAGTRALNSLFQRVLSSSSSPAKAKDPEPVPISKLYDNFLDGTSSTYLEELERRYQKDPNSVDKTWASFFSMASTSPSQYRASDQSLQI